MASSFDKLPTDLQSDVLQRLPAKELCRLRTVCSSWRSLTSDESFIRAHSDSHREEPLFLAKFRHDDTHVYVVDLAGNEVKQIARTDNGGHQLLRTRLKLASVATEWNRCRLLNPATGGTRVLPLLPAMVYYTEGLCVPIPCTFFSLGLVASTGEYKLLRCWRASSMETGNRVQVLTIDDSDGGRPGWRWRARPGPRRHIDMHSGVVVDGVVYFLPLPEYCEIVYYGNSLPADDILSFDLATEEWRRDLHGPLSTGGNVVPSEGMLWGNLTLADLKGSLVLAHRRQQLSILDLWFLQDFESGLWVKEYSIKTEAVTSSFVVRHLMPLLVLHDGRLVIYLAPIGLRFICDPRTNTFTRVDMEDRLGSVAVYTGSLLSLQKEAMV